MLMEGKILEITIPLAEPPGRQLTGFIRNPTQKDHYPTVVTNHPEHPDRIRGTLNRLAQTDIAEHFVDLTPEVVSSVGTDEYMIAGGMHSRKYLKMLRDQRFRTQTEINEVANQFDSVQLTNKSYDAAREAAACALRLTAAVCSGRIRNGFALIRPPGHHALHSKAEGFCILNNVAIAARAAIELFRYKKVLIVDFDIHHGHGTQAEFYDSSEVTYLSIHRYEDGNYWPHLRSSDFNFLGSGKGAGHNINIPINENGGTHHDYLYILFTIVLPIARELRPDVVFISAGFDACIGDPIGYMDVDPEVFPHYIYHLSSVCNGRVVCVLEGGYNHSAVAVCIDLCMRTLVGEKPPRFKFNNMPRMKTIESCLNSIYVNCHFWPCLYIPYQVAPPGTKRHNVHLGVFNTNPAGINTGNVVQQALRNLENSRPPRNVELPITKIYNAIFDLSHHEGIEFFKRVPNVNQYEQLRQIIKDFRESTKLFQSSVYYIRQEENESQKSEEDSDMQIRGLLPCGYETRKRKIPRELDLERKTASPPLIREFKTAVRHSGNVAKPVEDVFEGPYDDLGDLMEHTALYALETDPKNRVMVVNWGFERSISSSSTRLRVISVCQEAVESNTSTSFACSLSLKKKYRKDDLLAIIDRLLVVAGYTYAPNIVILCLKFDGRRRGKHKLNWGHEDVLRPLIWTLQGVFNRRLLILVDGKRQERIGLYAGLSHYGKEPTLLGLPRMKVSRSVALAIVNAMVKCPPEGKSFLANHMRRLDAHLRVDEEDNGEEIKDDESDDEESEDNDD